MIKNKLNNIVDIKRYSLSNEQYKQSYYDMLLVRRFEEKCGQLYGMGLIGGFCHLYIGQEAVISGVQLAKSEGDSLITSYRDHGHAILSGLTPREVLAELMGKATGCSKGKGGSMHMFNVPGKFYGGHGIVGAQVPIGTGIAFAEKYNGTKNICFTFMGDGAVHQGQVYESFNMAKLWNLPVLYIIENNEYSMGTSVSRSTGQVDLYKRGESFGIPGKRVDGMNLDSVYEACKEAVDAIRDGSGPLLLEMKTYRYRGHSMSDPGKYRSKEEVLEYKENRDPITSLEQFLLKSNISDENWLKETEKKIKAIIQDAVDFCENSSEPLEEELLTDIISE